VSWRCGNDRWIGISDVSCPGGIKNKDKDKDKEALIAKGGGGDHGAKKT